MADRRQRTFNENTYVPPSDDDESANEDYEISLPGSDESDGGEHEDQPTVKVTTSHVVNCANNVLYNDVLQDSSTSHPLNPLPSEYANRNGDANLDTSVHVDTDVGDVRAEAYPNAHPAVREHSPNLDATDNHSSPPDLHTESDAELESDSDASNNSDTDFLAHNATFTPITTFANDYEDPDDFANG